MLELLLDHAIDVIKARGNQHVIDEAGVIGHQDHARARAAVGRGLQLLEVIKAHLDNAQRNQHPDKEAKGIADAGAGIELALFGITDHEVERVKPDQR